MEIKQRDISHDNVELIIPKIVINIHRRSGGRALWVAYVNEEPIFANKSLSELLYLLEDHDMITLSTVYKILEQIKNG